MTNHADHAVVDELLRDLDRDARIGLVVLYVEHEAHGLAAHGRMFRVLFVERELRTVLQILADARDGPCQRAGEADLDGLRGRGLSGRGDRAE